MISKRQILGLGITLIAGQQKDWESDREQDRGTDMKSVQRSDHPKSNSPVHFIDGMPPLARLTVIGSAAQSC